MEDETEVIRHQMAETRESLSDKLDTLEQTVIGRVESVADTVTDTVEQVRNTVQQTVDSVKDTAGHVADKVKETLDVRQHVANHPWAMLAGSMAVGFIGSMLLTPTRRHPVRESGLAHHPERWMEPAAMAPPRMPARTEPSWLDRLMERLEPATSKLKEMAIGASAGMVSDMLLKSVPASMHRDVSGLIDECTTALGGKPMPHAPAMATTPSAQATTDYRPHNRLAPTPTTHGNNKSAS